MQIMPCPFCGSEAAIIKHHFGYNYRENSYCVRCTKCYCKSPSITATTYMWYHGKQNFVVTDEKAIHDCVAKWNTRTAEAMCTAT